MSKKDPGHGRKDRDVLDNLGELIGEQIEKGRRKLKELGADGKKKDDDGNFMGYMRPRSRRRANTSSSAS